MSRRHGNRPIKPLKKPMPTQTTKAYDESLDEFKNFTIAVSYEWDGKPPRMTWYDRLHRKGIRVRGGDTTEFQGPLARRRSLDKYHQHNGVVFQEGFILCRNQDIANELAYEAEKFGAVNVWVGRVFMDKFTASVQDVSILEEHFLKTSKRGRKPIEQEGTYTVTCLEELLTYESKLEAQPIACPTCNTYRFFAHMGNKKVYQRPKWSEIDNLYEYWLRSRFDQNDVFEIPELVKPSKEHMALLPREAVPNIGQTLFDGSEPTLYLPTKAQKIPPDLQLRVWDACYSLSTKTEDDRVQARLGILGAYWNAGGKNTDYSMSFPDDGFDLIDICCLLRDEFSKYL